MKNYTLLFFGIMMMLYACESSVTYKGSWYATTEDGKKFKIKIDDKTITIKDSIGKSERISYKENTSFKNEETELYLLEKPNEEIYQVVFNHSDTKYGIITSADGEESYAISKKDYADYENINNKIIKY